MGKVNVGGKPIVGTAVAADILATKTATTPAGLITGSMVNRGAPSASITTKTQEVPITEGYHETGGIVYISAVEQGKILPANIKKGINLLGEVGTHFNQVFYSGGLEEITLVPGIATGAGSTSKGATCFNVIAGGSSVAADRSLVTDIPIDLTPYKYLIIDWDQVDNTGSSAKVSICISTNKMGNHDVYDLQEDMTLLYRHEDIIDISTLNGSYYIRVHAEKIGTSTTILSNAEVYNISLTK